MRLAGVAAKADLARVALLTDHTSYADALCEFVPARLWELFDGDRYRLNIAHECIDRYSADPGRTAIRIAHADGHDEAIAFRTIAEQSSRYAHWLSEMGVAHGDRVAIMLEPSLAFYAALFGTMKLGAIAVPLFTLFGPDGVRLRLDDCSPRLLLTTSDKVQSLGALSIPTIAQDDTFAAALSQYPTAFVPATRCDDLAIYQYTSGTTRELPAAIRHTHRAIVVVMIAALYGTSFARAIGSSVRHHRPGGTGCGTGRSRHWRLASRPAFMPAASMRNVCCVRCKILAPPIYRPRRRTTA